MSKSIRYALYATIVLFIAIPAIVLGPYYWRLQQFEADPADGYFADFFLYVSPDARESASSGKKAVLLIQPNNSATNSDDPEVHRDDAWWMCFGRHYLADDLGVILLVPAFVRPAEDWHIYTHALDRDVLTTRREDLSRIDLQLLAMIAEARAELARQGIATEEKVLLQGYSASGMFANRFAALHPRSVMAVAAGSPGGWPVAPVADYLGAKLQYPAGVADLDSLTGEAFDSLAYRAIPQLIVMGDKDDNDSVDFSDGWDKGAAGQLDSLFGDDPISRWPKAEALYRKAGANAEFVLVEGVGHDRRALQEYSTRFFREILGK